MKSQQVILVNENDDSIGSMEKIEAHRRGLMHRALSIFIFNSQGEMLLQQRALNKYHSAGLWSNACCGHPLPDEATESAAKRRLQEELGFTTPLKKIFDFSYKVSFANGLMENEFDHVFVGRYDGKIDINPDEVIDYSFQPLWEIRAGLQKNPEKYTEWFKMVFSKIEQWWKANHHE